MVALAGLVQGAGELEDVVIAVVVAVFEGAVAVEAGGDVAEEAVVTAEGGGVVEVVIVLAGGGGVVEWLGAEGGGVVEGLGAEGGGVVEGLRAEGGGVVEGDGVLLLRLALISRFHLLALPARASMRS